MEVRITHIHLSGGETYRHIQSVRWQNADNSSEWDTDSTATMVGRLRRGWRVFVWSGWSKVEVVAVGGRYLSTETGGQLSQELLKLPRF
ncbi:MULTISPECIES: DUF3892 domain-containing protein [Crossiella]|uniref:DUF3892 domain-containing protein n=1 Tax=Crossiella cryophila TaxID=43355 RepID=A0A7W7FQQ6_9PSEU|nr:DUF3892 domain-containing protein [Crossiella cryophila]MBB4674392.1 hypothetical protein [Crossiella cryophila]